MRNWKKLIAALLLLAFAVAGCAKEDVRESEKIEEQTPSPKIEPSVLPVVKQRPEPLQEGMEGEKVEELQARLVALNYLDWEQETGSYGPETFYAVKAFQVQNGLEVSGIADEQMQELLYSDEAKECDPFDLLAPTTHMSFEELVMSDDGTRNYYPKGYPQAGTYQIIVDLKHQVTMVFSKDEEGNYTVPVRYMLCSTGKNDCTPKGKFKMDKYHVRFSQFVRDKTYGQFWTQIRGAIYFHSILYSQFDTSTYIEEVWGRFGKADSHGCVRLTVPDAKWMYFHIAPGTECIVRNGDDSDAETAAIRERLVLAALPGERVDIEPSQIVDTDYWREQDIPIETPFVQGSQN